MKAGYGVVDDRSVDCTIVGMDRSLCPSAHTSQRRQVQRRLLHPAQRSGSTCTGSDPPNQKKQALSSIDGNESPHQRKAKLVQTPYNHCAPSSTFLRLRRWLLRRHRHQSLTTAGARPACLFHARSLSFVFPRTLTRWASSATSGLTPRRRWLPDGQKAGPGRPPWRVVWSTSVVLLTSNRLRLVFLLPPQSSKVRTGQGCLQDQCAP